MKWVRRKVSAGPDESNFDSESLFESGTNKIVLLDYIKFAVFCVLLIVPVYAIARSAINQDWIMVIIDVLLVPVGFVHGLLLLFGFVS